MTILYKYRTFNTNSLHMLCEKEVYYSTPSKFNDPLDCSPVLIFDIPFEDLEKLCYQMLANEIGENKANEEIEWYRHNSSQSHDYETNEHTEQVYSELLYTEFLHAEIERLFFLYVDKKGVFSLTKHWNCPLMWSHYADEHKGICIGYDTMASTEQLEQSSPKEIDYKGNREVLVSTLMEWIIDKSKVAEETIINKSFYTKANQWEYENEYRIIHKSSEVTTTPFEIKEIIFGMRCDKSVKASIIQLMKKSKPSLTFYSINTKKNTFELTRKKIKNDEFLHYDPKETAASMFKDVF